MKKTGKWALRLLQILIAALLVVPIIWTIACSFLTEEIISEAFGGLFVGSADWKLPSLSDLWKHFSLSQYSNVLILSPDYLFRFWRSVFLVVPIVVFQLLFACPAAYGFSQSKSRLAAFFFFLYILLMLLPYQVTVIPNYLMAKHLGLTETDWSIWLPGIFAPFAVYLLTRYMKRIPVSLFEAGRIDGAGEWRIFLYLALPVCRGQVAACAILIFIDYWNMVELPLVMFSKALSYPLSIYLSKIQSGEIGISFAASVIYMVPVILVFLYGEEELSGQFFTSDGLKG